MLKKSDQIKKYIYEIEEAIRLSFELRRRNAKFKKRMCDYSKIPKSNRLKEANVIFCKYKLFHNPKKKIPIKRKYALSVNQNDIRKGKSVFWDWCPVLLLNRRSRMKTPWRLVSNEINRSANKIQSLIANKMKTESKDVNVKSKIKKNIEHEKLAINNQWTIDGLYLPVLINIWDTKSHISYYLDEVIKTFRLIFSREHDFAKANGRFKDALRAWDIYNKLKTQRSTKGEIFKKINAQLEISPSSSESGEKIAERLVNLADDYIRKLKPYPPTILESF